MRILQLTSDWKWTGPAEPMLRLGLALRQQGAACEFAFPAPPRADLQSLAVEAERVGVASVISLSRARGARAWGDRAEIRELRNWLATHRPAIVHCWHTRDHLLALRSRRGLLRGMRPRIVRSYRSADAIAPLPWNRWLFGPGADGLLCVSPGAAHRNRRLRGGRPLLGRFGAVDLERFRPAPVDLEMRRALGLKREHRVIGIVARVQPQRRFDLLLDAAERLFARRSETRLLVVGRGSRRAEVAEVPAQARGIADRIRFAGYRGADYARVLHCIDVFTFLVPGSDGTCRALLEAQACGLPAVTSRRGALPEIVADGASGLCVEEDPIALSDAWERLLRDDGLRHRFARAARSRAERFFRPEDLAREVASFYDTVLCREASSR